mgnify:CR=1 FL=1
MRRYIEARLAALLLSVLLLGLALIGVVQAARPSCTTATASPARRICGPPSNSALGCARRRAG